MIAIVTVGLPGCGKSTFAAELGEGYIELNLDDFRRAASGDAADQDATGKALWLRDRALERLAAEGKNLVVSDTHARRRVRTRMIKQLRALGYEVHLVFFNVGEQTCRERNRARARQVPEEAIASMARSLRDAPPTREEADRFTVIAPSPDRLF